MTVRSLLQVSTSLNRKFIAGTTLGLLAVSCLFLILFAGMYRGQLQQEKTHAADQVNRLLQTSLEAAMLRRDLDMLRSIVNQLGDQQEIQGVSIVNRLGEIRFSDHAGRLGNKLAIDCGNCAFDPASTTDAFNFFTRNDEGREVLRTVHPVRNRIECKECHGAAENHPVNGTLIVDYTADTIQHHARTTTAMLMGAGAVVVFVNLLGGWWFIRRFVLRPVENLAQVSRSLEDGNLAARTNIDSQDELGRLGKSFNRMADNLQESLKQIKDKEAFLQRLIDANPDGLRVIDGNYNIVLANKAYCEQQGVTRDQVIGHTCHLSSHANDTPCMPTLVSCPVERIAATGEPLKTVHQHSTADGRQIAVEIYAAPMQDPDGEQDGKTPLIVESIRDLGRTVEISHEHKLSEIGRLAAGVAHEIHNPLASVRLALDSALRICEQPETKLPEQVSSCMELVDNEINRCIEVTERLLKMSMFAGSETQIVAVNQAISECLSLLQWEAEADHIEIRQRLDDSQPRILANESDLRIVVLNLVQNAFHAMPDGGTLTITTVARDDWIDIQVEDTGVGIHIDELQHIFHPFFSRRADDVVGTGLGLSITQALVQRYGGKITVSSTLQRGSCFTVSFPNPEQEMERQS
jgi:PAS domain S-box-containing protein